MYRSLKAGRRVKLDHVGLFADGVAVRQVGVETVPHLPRARRRRDPVDTDAICAAIKDVFEDTRSDARTGGRARDCRRQGMGRAQRLRGKTLVAVACGANMNFDRLRFVAEEAELGEKREACSR